MAWPDCLVQSSLSVVPLWAVPATSKLLALHRFLFSTIRHRFQVNLLQYCLYATVACSQHRILPLLPLEGVSMWMGVLRHLGFSIRRTLEQHGQYRISHKNRRIRLHQQHFS